MFLSNLRTSGILVKSLTFLSALIRLSVYSPKVLFFLLHMNHLHTLFTMKGPEALLSVFIFTFWQVWFTFQYYKAVLKTTILLKSLAPKQNIQLSPYFISFSTGFVLIKELCVFNPPELACSIIVLAIFVFCLFVCLFGWKFCPVI